MLTTIYTLSTRDFKNLKHWKLDRKEAEMGGSAGLTSMLIEVSKVFL